MRRLNITPAEMESVCGRMVACRAAERLGLNINQFYYIAKKLSLKTAFVKPRWSDDEDKRMQTLISSGYTQRNVAKILGRSEESVKSRLSRLRKK
ncbi:sigma-70 family RNA polymerase sigma factor [Salmonella enterica subsp. enterica serovar Typhimurium]|uniref:Sigma-70 family RNA polymerase sigma factor n=5 Tax=Salmonella enterica TaxID=28901 RepID=A0A630JFD1_SALER|nr:MULTISPECIES: sigma-70 family RNA polymerase sigma factor [Salmonella]EAA7743027.1 sigma-70 family RNA polymerase sigma factor [Salmonella enterica subsp. enterica serovar 4,[5],12:i:-]EBH8401680.1 sigma-70 family RNA polymerase sigma factor [Salmonella enterica subsp. enterica serovar Teko]EBS4096035.1 sigma-70 family RNA polymerase sigma factor [Salmonella enterica subsp. enterica serovar Bareilly]EBU9600177.1 sigma-70 family RNA polymerase sigma factor [Salmonella enterica subsp. enterica